MGDIRDDLKKAVVEVGAEFMSWAIGKVRDKLKKAASKTTVDDKAIAELVLAELNTLYLQSIDVKNTIEDGARKLEEADERFRNSSNVTVVGDMSEPFKGEE